MRRNNSYDSGKMTLCLLSNQAMLLEDHSFRSAISNVYELIDRGQAVYIIAHIADKPSELHFYGMSYD